MACKIPNNFGFVCFFLPRGRRLKNQRLYGDAALYALPKRFFDQSRPGKNLLRLLVRARNHVDAHQLADTPGGCRSGFGGGLDGPVPKLIEAGCSRLLHIFVNNERKNTIQVIDVKTWKATASSTPSQSIYAGIAA